MKLGKFFSSYPTQKKPLLLAFLRDYVKPAYQQAILYEIAFANIRGLYRRNRKKAFPSIQPPNPPSLNRIAINTNLFSLHKKKKKNLQYNLLQYAVGVMASLSEYTIDRKNRGKLKMKMHNCCTHTHTHTVQNSCTLVNVD